MKCNRVNLVQLSVAEYSDIESTVEATVTAETNGGADPADDVVAGVSPDCSSTKQQQKGIKRVSERVSDNDSDAEAKKPVKHSKHRWTEEENSKLYAAFGSDITAKVTPAGGSIAELAVTMGTRTTLQIRTQIHNYVSGKLSPFV